MQKNDRISSAAETNLYRMVQDGQATQQEAAAAARDRNGPLWEQALVQAKKEEGGDPLSYMELLISPAMWLTLPWRLASGQANKISQLPYTRTVRALATATGIDAINLLDVESRVRKAAGVDQFGEWTDYYIDRQLSNMAADGAISARDALIAMNERTGPAYEQAVQRVQMEQALYTPGTAQILAARGLVSGKSKVSDLAAAMLYGWLPSGLFPEGELKLRGLNDEYNKAWKGYNQGNKNAINDFFAKYPEYETRLALWDKPEERLRQFLISEVWDRYTQMPALNRKQVADQLGPTFQEQFLSKETRDYDSISPDTLAWWSGLMGGYYPK